MTPIRSPTVQFLRDLLTPGSTLVDRTVTGALWLSLLNAADRLVRLVTLVLLASVLSPAAFGLFGLGLLALAVMRHGSKLGLDAALISDESDDVDASLDTVWVLKIARGIGLAAIGFVVAPVVASVFGAPRLTDVIRVVAVVPLLAGLRNPGVVYFHKELDFRRQFIYEGSGTVAYAVLAIAVAVVSPTVWALVAGILAMVAARSFVSFGIHPYRPGFGFDRVAARRMLGYGKWIFGSGIVVLALNWIDDAVIGWSLGAASLGLYRLAFTVSMAPTTEVTNVASTVMFPAYARLQNDTAALREAFVRTLRLVAYLSFPMAVGIAAVAPTFVRAFFSPTWEPMIPVIQVLVVWAAFRSIATTIGPLFRATDQPAYNTALQAFRLVVLAVVLYPAIVTWGLPGAAAALVLSGIAENPVALYVAARRVEVPPRRLVRSLTVPALASVVMGAVVVACDLLITDLFPPAEFVVLVLIGVATYPGIVLIWSRVGHVGITEDVAAIRGVVE